MKSKVQIFGLLLWLPWAQGGVIDGSTREVGPIFTNPPSEVPSSRPSTRDIIVIEGFENRFAKDFSPPIIKPFIPTIHYADIKDLSVRELAERQGVCAYIASCAGYITASTPYYAMQAWDGLGNFCNGVGNGVMNFFTENNYAQSKAILTGAMSNFIVSVPMYTIGYYFGQAAKMDGSNPSNTCGTHDPAQVAENVANAAFQFCNNIKTNPMYANPTRYTAGSMSDGDPTWEGANDGLIVVKKFWIGGTEYDTIASCPSYGIVWRRNFEAALERGKHRVLKKKRLSDSME